MRKLPAAGGSNCRRRGACTAVRRPAPEQPAAKAEDGRPEWRRRDRGGRGRRGRRRRGGRGSGSAGIEVLFTPGTECRAAAAEPDEADDEPESEPVEVERSPDISSPSRAAQPDDFMVLPGESLAKYSLDETRKPHVPEPPSPKNRCRIRAARRASAGRLRRSGFVG